MSWVLILTPALNAPPAVIGGYPTREAAELAGDLATMPIPSDERTGYYSARYAAYNRYTVIPGAAVSGVTGCTHSFQEYVGSDKPGSYRIKRTTYRYAPGVPDEYAETVVE